MDCITLEVYKRTSTATKCKRMSVCVCEYDFVKSLKDTNKNAFHGKEKTNPPKFKLYTSCVKCIIFIN